MEAAASSRAAVSRQTTADENTIGTPIGPVHSSSSRSKSAPSGSHDFSKMSRRSSSSGVEWEPISVGDEAALRRIATQLSRKDTRRSSGAGTELERKDTLDGLELGDPVLDPSSDSFDSYKWARKFMQAAHDQGVKERRAGFVFRSLNVSGSGSALNLQKNVGSALLAPLRFRESFSLGHSPEKKILRDFNGYLREGEMLMVLGRPGSGCTTFLKSICGEHHGLHMDEKSVIHFNGIPQKQMIKEFRGEVVYNGENEHHFPHLTVGQTLEFAASARTPQNRLEGMSRADYVNHVVQVGMAIFGLSHTYNTKVGNDFIRGVSGGERKRVSIAEMAAAGAPVACWDNSTRGLDAATALKFTKSLRMAAKVIGSSHAVAIYQASQDIYDIFDKVVVLYQGRQIYYGSASKAQAYFEEMGWHNPSRQTTADFLTSVTNPDERTPRKGYENKVPRTPDEFESYWRASSAYAELQQEMDQYERDYPIGGRVVGEFQESKQAQQAKHVRPKSPYMISIPMQVGICMKRAYQRIWNDKTSTLTTVIGQMVMALIIGSVFFGTPDASGSFMSKGAVLFFAILLNALIAISEINALYDQRPIVEKHASYAFYHPFAEALAGIVSDLPVKFIVSVAFNIILYFMAGLRTEPSQFFIYFLFVFISTIAMSGVFRTLAAATKTISQALAMAGVLVLAIVIYTGYVIPRPQMHPWFKWISYINPIYYAFEAIIANEFHGRDFICSQFVPAYPDLQGDQFICAVTGAIAGQRTVSGDTFIMAQYEYSYSHVWRNFGILLAFLMFFEFIYLLATELNSSTSSTAEVLVFRRGHVPKYMQNLEKSQNDGGEAVMPTEPGTVTENTQEKQINVIPPQKDIFTWRNVTYDIPVKEGTRRLLDNVSGWVRPGTLTALMGVSGAGKTTLLDVLAQRVSIGVVTGDMFVNGKPLDASFPRKTGYVQQQDLHLETSTVREALRFSAMLRQPKTVSKQEKYDYVEEVIKMLAMEDFAEAVVGQPGEGLNVEQRKLLTIGVELAAKPALLLFLDEPTSGLDSQSSWAICAFLRKLADAGQAVLSTIHQPSAILFQEFDRLLFLAKGGRTVYFGDIGKNSETLLQYFESNGARHCDDSENPAEYMLEIIGAGSAGKSTQDWPEVWKGSQQAKDIQTGLDDIHREKEGMDSADNSEAAHSEFAMPFASQLQYVVIRVFQQYWRLPSYIFGKLMLGFASAFFIGFSFWRPDSSSQGFQDVIFSVFMLTAIFTSLVQQIMPRFVTQRSLYEVRERPSKAYTWKAFLIANIIVEIPYQILLGVIVFAAYYFPIYTATQSTERQGLILLFIIQFFVFASTFAHMVIAALPDAETAGQIATLLFSLTLTFNGVMQSPTALPGFWIFMYRVSPLTYLVSGIVSTGLHGRDIVCSAAELQVFNPPPGTTCGAYLQPYLAAGAPGRLYNAAATQACQYCQLSTADQFLAASQIFWADRWRNFGIGWAFVLFNVAAATLLYYAFRVRHWSPSAAVDAVCRAGNVVGRLFRRRSGDRPKGQEAVNNRIY